MSTFKVAIVGYDADEVPGWVVEKIENEGITLSIKQCADSREVVPVAKDADVVWVFGYPRVVTAEILPQLKRCAVILRSGSGADNVPVDEATRQGIIVANTPEGVSQPVAVHTIALMLALVRRIAVQDRAVRAGVWNREVSRPTTYLENQTLGLVGFGRIARSVARKISGFEMKLVAFDPLVEGAVMSELGVERVSLDSLLAQSDFVSIHCPLTEQTRHIIGERELRMMKPKAILINAARGGQVDEAALAQALTEGWIAGAGLDVLDKEPPDPDNPLLTLDNVVLTPHIAGHHDMIYPIFWDDSARTIIEMAKHRRPLWCVNSDVIPRFQGWSTGVE